MKQHMHTTILLLKFCVRLRTKNYSNWLLTCDGIWRIYALVQIGWHPTGILTSTCCICVIGPYPSGTLVLISLTWCSISGVITMGWIWSTFSSHGQFHVSPLMVDAMDTCHRMFTSRHALFDIAVDASVLITESRHCCLSLSSTSRV